MILFGQSIISDRSGGFRRKIAVTSNNEKIWLATPTMHGDELKYMTEAYHTNWMSTLGENINEAERLACQQTGSKYAVGLGSGTAALHMAVKLAGVKPGDRVFCTDMTFAATVNPVVYEKAEPIFIDTEPDTWNMDPIALEKAFKLYPDVKVVVIVHLYGTPAKMDELKAVCDQYGAIIIEDAAESLGATYKGKQTGSLGTYNCISFNGNKIITGSSGGMLLTDDKTAADKARKWSTQSRENAPWYQHEEVGYNYRMSNVIAGVVRGQFPYLSDHIARKKAIFDRYQSAFTDLPVRMNPYDAENSMPNFWLSCLLIDREAMCKQERGALSATFVKEPGKTCPTEILEKLAEDNIEGRPIWKPMHMQPIYRDNAFVTDKEGADVGADIFDRGLCLPSDIKMTTEEQDRVIRIVRSCFA
ncbi:MAG: aminotransferase class I/II-fold pyridoxal phosphate-dependent enzyme [Ruminococcaceae bacterium]|nr:aminotransferase class I/II-fold pyridoxal phosphate-dependent enzyme [Oscillospiraceae bacterium]